MVSRPKYLNSLLTFALCLKMRFSLKWHASTVSNTLTVKLPLKVAFGNIRTLGTICTQRKCKQFDVT